MRILSLVLLVACADAPDKPAPDPDPDPVDADGDGANAGADCDDTDASVYPGATEVCDGVDQDCDGDTDEDAQDAPTWYTDGDGDGHGDASAGAACAAPAGAVAAPGDCDDADATVHPGAQDVCDAIDQDCDPASSATGVALDGTPGFATIGEALALAVEGSVVSVCSGTWTERLDIGMSLTLVAPAGPDATVVDAGGGGPALTVRAGTVRVEGLTLTGGAGGGVVATEADAIEIVDCVITGNTATSGGGVTGPAAGPLRIEGGRIVDNVAEDYGGGVYATDVTLDGVELSGNQATDGGGLFLEEAGVATVVGATFASNGAENIGGGAYVGIGARLDARDTRWDGDRATVYAGGIYLDEGAAFSDVDGVFDNVASDDKGGAVYARYATVTLDGTAFTGNSGTWGGAMFLYGTSLVASGASFRYNAADLGGALYVYAGSSATLDGCAVEGNTASSGGGARLRTDASLVSTNTSWGVAATDNIPEDVNVTNSATYFYGDAATFTCSTDAGTCQ